VPTSDARELAAKQKAAGKQDWPDDFLRKLIHAYFACISYIDAQIGQLLDTLEQTGLARNTVVMLWGDHGWHLGGNGTWASTRIWSGARTHRLFCTYPAKPILEPVQTVWQSSWMYIPPWPRPAGSLFPRTVRARV